MLFSEYAEMSSENSVLSVPISRESRDLSGPRIYDALENRQCRVRAKRAASETH